MGILVLAQPLRCLEDQTYVLYTSDSKSLLGLTYSCSAPLSPQQHFRIVGLSNALGTLALDVLCCFLPVAPRL